MVGVVEPGEPTWIEGLGGGMQLLAYLDRNHVVW